MDIEGGVEGSESSAANPAPTTLLAADLKCPICLSLLCEPFVTSCGHTYCHICIFRHLASGNKNCPVCSKYVSAETLFPNFLLNQIVSRAAQHTSIVQHASPLAHLEAAVLSDSCKCTAEELGQLIGRLQEKQALLQEAEAESNIDLLMQFLEFSRQQKAARLHALRDELVTLDQDIANVQRRHSAKGCLSRSPSAAGLLSLTAPVAQSGATQPVQLATAFASAAMVPLAIGTSRTAAGLALSRPDSGELLDCSAGEAALLRTAPISTDAHVLTPVDALDNDAHARKAKRQRIATQFEDLHQCYLELRARGRQGSGRMGSGSLDGPPSQEGPTTAAAPGQVVRSIEAAQGALLEGDGLVEFSRMLSVFASCGTLKVVSTIAPPTPPHSHAILSSIEFDRDGETFATGGVSKRISVYNVRDILLSPEMEMHVPANEIVTRSKLTGMSWNPYLKAHLISADYDGVVSLWDINNSKTLMEWEAHDKRIWSVDFCKVDPVAFASGSDDGWVKVWTTKQASSVLDINIKANVCCVEYNPRLSHELAVGSADHVVHVFDLRQPSRPLHHFRGHRKAVSYVRYLSGQELSSASIDGTLRLWRTQETGTAPVRCFQGHANEKNFVGLTATDEFVACGSETNEVYVYFKALSAPIAKAAFGHPAGAEESSPHFISAVRWQPGTRMLVAANSQGFIKLMKLTSQ